MYNTLAVPQTLPHRHSLGPGSHQPVTSSPVHVRDVTNGELKNVNRRDRRPRRGGDGRLVLYGVTAVQYSTIYHIVIIIVPFIIL